VLITTTDAGHVRTPDLAHVFRVESGRVTPLAESPNP
jgi:hypothetical protein